MTIQNYNLVVPKLNFNTSLAGGFGGAGFSSNFSNLGKFGGNSVFNFSTPLPFSTVVKPSSSAGKTETWEERQERMAKEQVKIQKEAQEKLKKEQQAAEKKEMETPLTDKEKEVLKKEVLELDAISNKKAQSSAGMAMAFPALTAVPLANKAIRSKAKTVEMFYKDGAAHMDLFRTNPELMTQAQETMQKLERKFARDIKAAKGNQTLIDNLTNECNFFRRRMEFALKHGDEKGIATVTAQCQAAAGVKNGGIKRLIRGFRDQDKFISRLTTVKDAAADGKFRSTPIPKESNKFLKNMFSSKLSTLMAVSMFVLPVITGWKGIKQARNVDKENKEKGVETHYGRKEITQTMLHATGSFVAYNVVDTAVRTLWKKALPKLAGKLAAKLAVKGTGKVIGGAIGSVLPGIGNLLGIVAGALFDLALNKFVFGKMKFFNNSGAKEAKVQIAKDADLLGQLSEQYMQGTDIKKQSLDILMKKYGKENFKELKRVHDMPEKERNTYLAQLQAAQQQEAQQQVAQQTAQLKKGF